MLKLTGIFGIVSVISLNLLYKEYFNMATSNITPIKSWTFRYTYVIIHRKYRSYTLLKMVRFLFFWSTL